MSAFCSTATLGYALALQVGLDLKLIGTASNFSDKRPNSAVYLLADTALL